MIKNITLLFIIILLSLVICEVILRLAGFQPWQNAAHLSKEPSTLQFDRNLGWKNKQGHHSLPPFDITGKSVTLNFLSNGQRKTKPAPNQSTKQLIFLGGSFTQGWGLNDEETFAWKVQSAYPDLDVLNYGTGGYGTYQSLLTLEQELPHFLSPKHIYYGFILHHEIRNTASGRWLGELTKQSHRGHAALPFVSLDTEQHLNRHSPMTYPQFPFRQSFALIAFAERFYLKIKTWSGFNQRREISKQLFLRMKEISNTIGASFTVILLTYSGDDKEAFLNMLKHNHIRHVDCVVTCSDCSHGLPRDKIILGDGHPNAQINSIWASCIANDLQRQ